MAESLIPETGGGHLYSSAINIYMYSTELLRPSYLYKPRLFIDSGEWCALLGENLQDGIAGFGKSPDEAYKDFDKSWYRKVGEARQ